MNIIKASKGTPQDFEMELQARIDELSSVASSTKVCRSRAVKCATGTPQDFAMALQNRISELSGVESTTSVNAATYTDPQGMFAEPGGTITDDDLKQYWDEHQKDDPSLSEFASYEEWHDATVDWFTPVGENDNYVAQLADAVCEALKQEFPDTQRIIPVKSPLNTAKMLWSS